MKKNMTFEEWQIWYRKWKKDYDALYAYFLANKKCECSPYGCRHFTRMLNKTGINRQIPVLFYARLNIAINTYYDYNLGEQQN